MKIFVLAATAFSMNVVTVCANENLTAADSKLNKTYNAIHLRLKNNKETAQHLLNAQRAWLQFRDAECAFQTIQTQGGTAQSEVLAACMANLTEKRTLELENYLDCAEGDLACPVPSSL